MSFFKDLKRGFNTREAAGYLGVSKSYLEHARVYGGTEDGADPPHFIKIGRTVRYLREDLDLWLEQFPKCRHRGELTRHK